MEEKNLFQKTNTLIGFDFPVDMDVTKISGSKAMHEDEDDTVLDSKSTARVINQASEVLAQRMRYLTGRRVMTFPSVFSQYLTIRVKSKCWSG